MKLTDTEKSKLKERTVVENFFAWMKSYRRLLMRYEKNVINYASFCYLGATNILCNKVFQTKNEAVQAHKYVGLLHMQRKLFRFFEMLKIFQKNIRFGRQLL